LKFLLRSLDAELGIEAAQQELQALPEQGMIVDQQDPHGGTLSLGAT
jgi:hypothetical protein